MLTSTNVHNVKEIVVKEDSNALTLGGEKTHWVSLEFKGDMGQHEITIFNTTILDFVNALEKALHEEGAIVNFDVVGAK